MLIDVCDEQLWNNQAIFSCDDQENSNQNANGKVLECDLCTRHKYCTNILTFSVIERKLNLLF